MKMIFNKDHNNHDVDVGDLIVALVHIFVLYDVDIDKVCVQNIGILLPETVRNLNEYSPLTLVNMQVNTSKKRGSILKMIMVWCIVMDGYVTTSISLWKKFLLYFLLFNFEPAYVLVSWEKLKALMPRFLESFGVHLQEEQQSLMLEHKSHYHHSIILSSNLVNILESI